MHNLFQRKNKNIFLIQPAKTISLSPSRDAKLFWQIDYPNTFGDFNFQVLINCLKMDQSFIEEEIKKKMGTKSFSFASAAKV